MKAIPALLAFGCLFFAGCETVQRIAETESGKPEMLFETAELGIIKSELISEFLNHNYSIIKDSEYMIEMKRDLRGAETILGTLNGNAYSTNYRVVTMNFAKLSSGIRVLISNRLDSQMPGGQINTMDMNTVEVFNVNQQFLIDLKAKLEGDGEPDNQETPQRIEKAGLEAAKQEESLDSATDTGIRAAINARLKLDSSIDASRIQVSVSNGSVTLSGKVSSRADERKAKDIAIETRYARDVKSKLVVEP